VRKALVLCVEEASGAKSQPLFQGQPRQLNRDSVIVVEAKQEIE